MTPPFVTSPLLAAEGARHGFFGRAGGVSTGMFTSLNAGLGSSDDPLKAAENRARCREALSADSLLTLYQVHSAQAVIVTEPWTGQGPKADGMATRLNGVALGVLAADCMPFLFADVEAGVVGAAHAGWRGALAGVLQSTVRAMVALGARRDRIKAAVGPCMRQPNFEVGLDVVDAFRAKYSEADQFFAPGVAADKRQLDLVAFGRTRLAAEGVERLDDVGLCTVAAPDAYFSYRISRRRGDADYGRNLSAITLRQNGT